MNEILINIKDRNFGGDFITVEELLNLCEDYIYENKRLMEEIEDIIQDRDDNYQRIKVQDQVGIYDIDFI